ncbi:hypothetical protein P1X14_02190 [Sphingomonas sp. AOB5]|uniref:hypothetical protein n=1 Tax=Sphingomonas sp. AOB5 TaxID=3034017 RepID=UPI0023F97F97|nr:hypothetical protein [Sphingomonas sp. AOB5]MDF7774043.1 hypothetical protein [Sphingomonas sp. AOB5]
MTTIRPGKLDLFAVTFIDGRRATVDPILDYEAALTKAEAFLRDHRCQVKVLPMTGTEVRNLLGIGLPDHPEPIDAAVRQQIIDTLTQVVCESSDADARGDAVALLTAMGVFRP